MANIVFKKYKPANTDGETIVDLEIGIFFDGTKNNKGNSDARNAEKNSNEYQAFLEYGQEDKESSYYNDWSNVARLWKHYKKSNAIYVEGIGTGQDNIDNDHLFRSDTTIAYAVGQGPTGIRKKVRKGCEYLAKKILEAKQQLGNKEILRTIYLDVCGFSRGATAARNFNYEIYKSKYKPTIKTIDEDKGKSVYYYDDDDIAYQVIYNNQQKPKYTILPDSGHLGYCLKELDLDIKRTQIVVRFLGLFDTVSSYMEGIDLKINDGLPLPNFSNDVDELKLNNLKAENIIHFTARDEHRETFALTRVPYGIEKSFPGVHSDIGGGYNTGTEIVNKLETEWFGQFKKKGIEELNKFRTLLIKEGWFIDKQLIITGGNIITPHALKGSRYLKKEYSYIPLHFMSDYLSEKSNLLDITKLYDEYSIKDIPLLNKIKNYLTPYIKNITNKESLTFTWFSQINKDDTKSIQEQHDLRELRNKYLHWSSTREGAGMDPKTKWYNLKDSASEGRKRKEY